MTIRLRSTKFAGVAICAVVLAACGGTGTTPSTASESAAAPTASSGESASEKPVVRVGVLYPLTGPSAEQAAQTLAGVELAAEVLNGEHPDIDLPALENVTVELVVADTQSNPQICAQEINRFKDEGVSAVVGGFGSSETLACSQETERLELPYINGSASSPELIARGLEWFFHVGPTDDTFAATFVNWLEVIGDEHPVTTVAVIAKNDQYGNDSIAVIEDQFPEAGIEVVAAVTYDPTSADLSAQVQNIRAAEADAVIAVSNTADGIVLMRNMADLDFRPQAFLGFGGAYNDPAFFDAVGPLATNIVTRAAWSPVLAEDDPIVQAVADLYESNSGIGMSENSARDFTAMRILGMAIDAAGSADPTAIRDALREVETDLTIQPWEGVRFDEAGHNVLASGVIQQWTGEEFALLYPEDLATAEVVWPMGPVESE